MPLTSYRKRANSVNLPDFTVDMFSLTGTAPLSRVDTMYTASWRHGYYPYCQLVPCGDGMSFVQTPRDEAPCECETGYGWDGFDSYGVLTVWAEAGTTVSWWRKSRLDHGPNCFTETDDGRLLFSADYTDMENLVTWLMIFGAKVEVLESEEVRDIIRRNAEETLKIYEEKDLEGV